MFELLKSKQQELHRVRTYLPNRPSPWLTGRPGSLGSARWRCRRSQLANALIEHETLDMEEVKKVIRGEPIRNIKEVITEDLSRMAAGAPAPTSPSAHVHSHSHSHSS